MEIDDYIEIQRRCFKLLEKIADTQMKIQHNIERSKNVIDYDIYLKKQGVRLTALTGAKNTIDTMLRNIERLGNVDKRIKKIEAMLEIEEDGKTS